MSGWSLGGYLSLTVARFLAEDPEAKIKVLGIIMMDTPYHTPYSQEEGPTDDPVIENVPEAVQKCFDRCDEMLENWEVPKWDKPASDGNFAYVGVDGKRYPVTPGNLLYKPFDGEWSSIEVPQYKPLGESQPEEESGPGKAILMAPPTVLLRCTDPMPLPEGRTQPFIIDKYRSDRTLGWSGNTLDFIRAVIDVQSNHYEMFAKDHDSRVRILIL